MFARSKGYHEQAGRQDREARAQVAQVLRELQKKLQQEEARRRAIQQAETVRVVLGEDLRLVDCAELVWYIVDALGNPVINQRAASKVERDLKAVIGAPFINHLKERRAAPKRAESMSEMHDWVRELVQSDVVDFTKKRKPTPTDEMFDAERDPEPVARVRRQVEKIIAEVLREGPSAMEGDFGRESRVARTGRLADAFFPGDCPQGRAGADTEPRVGEDLVAERKFGFQVDRTLTLKGPFRRHPTMDARRVRASVDTQGVAYQVAVVITDPAERVFLGADVDSDMPDDERAEARARFALAELARRPVLDFKPQEPNTLPEILVSVDPGPDSDPHALEVWTIQSIRNHPALQAYTVSREGSTWTARPKS